MSYDLLFQQAIKAHEEGNFDAAEQLYRQILEVSPNNPDILNLLGLIAQSKGIHNQAMELFYQAIKSAPKHAPFYFNIAISLMAQGKNIEALDNLQKALDLAPDEKEIYYQQGLAYQRLNKISDAQKAFLTALNKDPDYIDAKVRLAMTYYDTDVEKALKFLNEIDNQYPENILCQYFLCHINFEQGNIKEAIIHGENAKKIDPKNDEVLALLGLIYLTQNNINEAKTNFQAALSSNPNNNLALINMANIETNENNFASAQDKYKKLLDLNPQDFDAHLNYANMLYKENRISESLDEYRAAVVINPDSAEASNNIGLILKDLKSYDEALGLFFNSLARDPKNETYSINIAETLILFHREDPETALKIAENWVRIDADNVYAQHTKASFLGEKIENNQVFSEKLFDNFANNYELVLEKINYSLPRRIRELAGNVKGTIVDLGCGSGLVGQALKTPENQIIGIDISRKMLKKAAEKNIYEKLIKADITAFCQQKIKEINPSLVIAADVFGYIGNLSPLLDALKGQKICFSVEVLTKDGDYELNEAGRYVYNISYLEQLLNNKGFAHINKYEVVLRQEDGKDVKGALYFAQ